MIGTQFGPGAENPKARLSELDVIAIREQRAAGATLREIAQAHHIVTSTVSEIARGLAWSCVPMREYRCPRQRARAERDARIRGLRAQGLGVMAISRELGVANQTVSRILRQEATS